MRLPWAGLVRLHGLRRRHLAVDAAIKSLVDTKPRPRRRPAPVAAGASVSAGTDSFPFRARETNYGLASDDATMTVDGDRPGGGDSDPTPTPGGTNADRTAPKVTLKATKYKLSRSIGKGSSTLTAAGSKAVTLKLSAKARKAFKKLRQMKVTRDRRRHRRGGQRDDEDAEGDRQEEVAGR